jgi:RNA polymerase sigma-70 factor (ECF subfamily)
MVVAARSAVPESRDLSDDARAQIRSLLTRLADGDRAAIEPAFDALWPVVERFCARALPNAADAEDAAQQAIVRAFDQVADYDPRRDALAWVLTIASYEVLTLRRRIQRRRETDAPGAAERIACDADPEAGVVQRDLIAAAREVLATLRPEDVAVITAAMGLSGGVLDTELPRATFRKRLQRALERLRVAWRTRHGTP